MSARIISIRFCSGIVTKSSNFELKKKMNWIFDSLRSFFELIEFGLLKKKKDNN